MTKTSYRDLRVWQMAMDVAVRIYEVTGGFPKHEQYGLAQQLRRAAVSISSNIAEGYGRKTHRQTFHFLETRSGQRSKWKHSLNSQTGSDISTRTLLLLWIRSGALEEASTH